MSRGHGPPQLGTLSNPGRTLRLQHQFLPSQQTQHYQQTQPLTRGVSSHNGAKTLYATHGTIANAPRFNQNSYEVSPASSFRYYSSSVEYLAGDFLRFNFLEKKKIKILEFSSALVFSFSCFLSFACLPPCLANSSQCIASFEINVLVSKQ